MHTLVSTCFVEGVPKASPSHWVSPSQQSYNTLSVTYPRLYVCCVICPNEAYGEDGGKVALPQCALVYSLSSSHSSISCSIKGAGNDRSYMARRDSLKRGRG